MGQTEAPQIEWRDGRVPVSVRFDDPYFSLSDGLAETRHVFLDGNDLPARLTPGFTIAELGFGTGLNLLTLLTTMQDARIRASVQFVSFEAFPMDPADMARALAAFPEVSGDAQTLVRFWDMGERVFQIGPVRVCVIEGDARQTLPEWDGRADAWFLDGFSPARNPELWGPGLMQHVADHTGPGGTFATYTAAGFVRAGLADAGFAVTRCPGHGRKRHMTRGVLEVR